MAFNTVFFMLIIFIFSSCSLDKNLEEMQKNTEDMSNDIEKIDGLTYQMMEMQKTMEYLLQLSRSKESEETRDRKLTKIQNEKTLENKILSAAAYYSGLEYQLFAPITNDSYKYLSLLFHTAVREFFGKLQGFISMVDDPSDISVKTRDSSEQVLLALSHSMHEIHDFYRLNAMKNSIYPISLYDIIKNGLFKTYKLNNNIIEFIDLKDHEKVIANYEQDAIMLIQHRINVYIAIMLNSISPLGEKGQGAIERFFTKISMTTLSWKTKFTSLNQVQQHVVNTNLRKAIEAKYFLKSIGIVAKIEPTFKRILKKMKFVDDKKLNKETARNLYILKTNLITLFR